MKSKDPVRGKCDKSQSQSCPPWRPGGETAEFPVVPFRGTKTVFCVPAAT